MHHAGLVVLHPHTCASGPRTLYHAPGPVEHRDHWAIFIEGFRLKEVEFSVVLDELQHHPSGPVHGSSVRVSIGHGMARRVGEKLVPRRRPPCCGTCRSEAGPGH
eukprot:1013586-Rhodomonas_salina.1